MGTKATLESVRAAHDDLVAQGEVPSANKVLERTGGSKTTVLKRLGEVQNGVQSPAPDESAAAFLHEIAAPMLRRVWTAARAQAEAEVGRRFDALLLTQEAQQQEIGKLHEAIDQWQGRAILAEEQLKARDSQDHQVQELIRAVADLKAVRVAGVAESRVVEKEVRSALDALMGVLAVEKEPITKAELDRAIVEAGHAGADAQKARFHALDAGYIGFILTVKGRKRLEAQASRTAHTRKG